MGVEFKGENVLNAEQAKAIVEGQKAAMDRRNAEATAFNKAARERARAQETAWSQAAAAERSERRTVRGRDDLLHDPACPFLADDEIHECFCGTHFEAGKHLPPMAKNELAIALIPVSPEFAPTIGAPQTRNYLTPAELVMSQTAGLHCTPVPFVGPTCLEAFRVLSEQQGGSYADYNTHVEALRKAAIPPEADAAEWVDCFYRALTLLEHPIVQLS